MDNWKEVEGYEDYYVSCNGEVVRKLRNEIIEADLVMTPFGEPMVLFDDGEEEFVKVLVARAFVHNDDPFSKFVIHVDGDFMNNHSDNLTWSKEGEITKDMIRSYDQSRRARSVYCYETGELYPSAYRASLDLNCNVSSIYKALRGEIESVKNYHFCYEDDIQDLEGRMENMTIIFNRNRKVYAKDLMTNELFEFGSQKEASEFLGIPKSSVCKAISGRLNATNGYLFSYEPIIS